MFANIEIDQSHPKGIYTFAAMYKIKVNDRNFEAEIMQDGNIQLDGIIEESDIVEYRKGKFHVLLNHQSVEAEIVTFDSLTKTFEIKVNSKVLNITIEDKYDILLKQMGIDVSAGKKVNDIKAPMPGMVLNVMVENGQSIRKGDAIVVLEAMKMENILKSPSDGIVRKIHVLKGDKVEKNQVMINLD